MELNPPLPSLDEHATEIAAGVEDVWSALHAALDRTFAGRWAATYARIIGCADHRATGPRPLAEGSTIPGFRVVAAVPERELALEGRHHFSSYSLTFRLEPIDSDRSRVTAASRASFPGLHGAVYRLLVVGTRGHVLAVRRLLAQVRHRAERAQPPS